MPSWSDIFSSTFVGNCVSDWLWAATGFRHELVFFVPHREGGELNMAQDRVNRAIARRFAEAHSAFAQPQSTP